MRADRLLKLADFLDMVPLGKFDMSSWTLKDPKKPFNKKEPFSCGFAGCAMGWAAHGRLFRGLSLNKYGTPVYESYLGFDAAEQLFQIDGDAAGCLFDEQGTPKQVAKRIRAFVKNHEKASTP